VGQFLGMEAGEAYKDRLGVEYLPVSVKVVLGNELVLVRYKSQKDSEAAVKGAQLLSEVNLRVRIAARNFGGRTAVFYEGV
jgi:hypothetical protein